MTKMFRLWGVLITSIVVLFALNTEIEVTEAEEIAEETQHAVCRIVAQQSEMFANATITRQLKGVCTTNQINTKLKDLELKLMAQLDQLKQEIRSYLNIKNARTTDSLVSLIATPTTSSDNYSTYDDYDYSESNNNNNVATETGSDNEEKSPRSSEIAQYNDTVHTAGKSHNRLYTYYWKIANIRSVIHKLGVHIRSPDFYVLGHQLCLQLYPNNPDSRHLGIQLRPSGNFLKKHTIAVLNRFDKGKDMTSRILGGLSDDDVMHRVANELIAERDYAFGDAVIVKLVVYLNSW